MTSKTEKSAKFAAEIILHLARLTHGEGSASGLTSAQWAALRYFAQANQHSRTLLAFADYHVITRGSASLTARNLIEKGLLTRRPSQLDRRSSRIDLTADGRALCEKDPLEKLVRTIAGLPPELRAGLLAALEQVMGRIVEDRQGRRFGACSTCRYLGESIDREDGGADYICRLTGLPLRRSEFDDLCINYKTDIERR